jgi:hypothetical protein
LGFTGSRLIVSILGATGVLTRVLGRTNEQALLVTLGVACVALMLALAFVRGRAATSATILLAGLATGPVFPTMMAVVLLSVQPDTMGRAVGFFFFFASVGWTVVPMIIGVVARKNQHPERFSHRRRVRRGIPDLDCDQGNDDRLTLGSTGTTYELRRMTQHHFDARGARALFSGRQRYSGRMRTVSELRVDLRTARIDGLIEQRVHRRGSRSTATARGIHLGSYTARRIWSTFAADGAARRGSHSPHEYQPVLEIKRTFDLPFNLNGDNAPDAKPCQTWRLARTGPRAASFAGRRGLSGSRQWWRSSDPGGSTLLASARSGPDR